MSYLLQRFASATGLAPRPYGAAALLILLLYMVQAEIRFGAKARTSATGAADRGSTVALSLSTMVPVGVR